ncbi:hypothetical protein AMECASPLE_036739 [Ameca splendens]|uniref:Uncharacterized protein n=1 Tax=Ameca splendens TaxID=208324 RepID=A0ABV0XKS2_9TELE
MASHPQHTTRCDGKTRALRNDTPATTHKHNRADSIELTSTLRSQPNSSSPREKKARPQQRKEKIKINVTTTAGPTNRSRPSKTHPQPEHWDKTHSTSTPTRLLPRLGPELGGQSLGARAAGRGSRGYTTNPTPRTQRRW